MSYSSISYNVLAYSEVDSTIVGIGSDSLSTSDVYSSSVLYTNTFSDSDPIVSEDHGDIPGQGTINESSSVNEASSSPIQYPSDRQESLSSSSSTTAVVKYVSTDNESTGIDTTQTAVVRITRSVSEPVSVSQAASGTIIYKIHNSSIVSIEYYFSASSLVASEYQTLLKSYSNIDATISDINSISVNSSVISILQLTAKSEIVSELNNRILNHSGILSLFSEKIETFSLIEAGIFDIDFLQSSSIVLSTVSTSSSSVETQSAYLILPDGSQTEFTGSIFCDEGSSFWQGDFIIELDTFNKVKIDDIIVCVLEGDSYTLLVDSRNRKVANAYTDVTYSITALSPVVTKQKPRSKGITITYNTLTSAKSIVEEMLDGFTIDWQILEWDIPANRLSIENGDRLETARNVAAAAGGLVESNPDGSLLVRYIFPVSPTMYVSTTPNAISTTEDHIYVYGEQDKINDYFNRIRISDVPVSDYRDIIEYIEDLSVLRGYTYPFDGEATISHTSSVEVSLNRIGVLYETIGDTEEEREIIEIVKGQGQTRYPIYEIQSFVYLYNNLGGLSFDIDSTSVYTSDTEGYSLVEVVYTTRYVQYGVTGGGVREAQFLLNRTVE